MYVRMSVCLWYLRYSLWQSCDDAVCTQLTDSEKEVTSKVSLNLVQSVLTAAWIETSQVVICAVRLYRATLF